MPEARPPVRFCLLPFPLPMDASQIYKLIYGGVGIFALFLVASRLSEGGWLAALFPLAIAGFCGYRLYTMTAPDPDAA